MRNPFYNFFSHRTLFYKLFNQAGRNAVEMAELLTAIVNIKTAEEREPLFRQINTLEENGDDITHKIYLSLDKVFFTPFNRKDIHTLTSAIDDIADNIHEAAGRMYMYGLNDFIPAISEIAAYILKACIEIEKLISSLNKIENVDARLLTCRQIKAFEHETDLIYYKALAVLFAEEKDAIKLIKYRDILYSLETSVNKCKNVTDAIEIILVNNI